MATSAGKAPSSNNSTGTKTKSKFSRLNPFRKHKKGSENPEPVLSSSASVDGRDAFATSTPDGDKMGLAVSAYTAKHNREQNLTKKGKRGGTTNGTTAATTSRAAPAATPAAAPATTGASKWAIAKQSTVAAKNKKTKEDPSKAGASDPPKTSWLTRTTLFQNMLEWAFEQVDADGSGAVDEQELYAGLLLIHLKLGTYAGPAACKPISRAQCHEMFVKMDLDKSGTLDKEEFDTVMMVLFGNALFRVVFQYSCTIALVPLLAQQLLSCIQWLIRQAYFFVTTLDEHSQWADTVEVSVENIWTEVVDYVQQYHIGSHISAHVPTQVISFFATLRGYLQAVPTSVWNSIPLTVISTVLSLMIIPWSLMKIDDFFQNLAEKKKESKAK